MIIAPEARKDLRDILRFTARRWGKQQRAVYKAKLDAGMHGLLTFPDRGHPRDHLSPGMRALLVEAHVVYYQSDDRAVTVLRILHGQLDAAEHLAPSSH
ncbi:MAG: type II toxin-antitoxin system RelE/ParE family toxin [Thermomicrobiales bacterium]